MKKAERSVKQAIKVKKRIDAEENEDDPTEIEKTDFKKKTLKKLDNLDPEDDEMKEVVNTKKEFMKKEL